MGFRVLALKDHRRFGEIDMVVFDGGTLVFVEIKTVRISGESVGAQSYDERTLGWPSIGQFKRQRRAVAAWLAIEGSQLPRAECVRLDVVKILLDERGELARLDHIEAAWEGAW
jgi:putative endonuclease